MSSKRYSFSSIFVKKSYVAVRKKMGITKIEKENTYSNCINLNSCTHTKPQELGGFILTKLNVSSKMIQNHAKFFGFVS